MYIDSGPSTDDVLYSIDVNEQPAAFQRQQSLTVPP
jgi:hypothetical protein